MAAPLVWLGASLYTASAWGSVLFPQIVCAASPEQDAQKLALQPRGFLLTLATKSTASFAPLAEQVREAHLYSASR